MIVWWGAIPVRMKATSITKLLGPGKYKCPSPSYFFLLANRSVLQWSFGIEDVLAYWLRLVTLDDNRPSQVETRKRRRVDNGLHGVCRRQTWTNIGHYRTRIKKRDF